MQLIGENIHIISNNVREALIKRDEDFIKNLIALQSNMDFIDLNVGPAKGNLEGIISWIVNIIQNNTDIGISFDTTNFREMKEGLEVYNNSFNSFINSTFWNKDKLENMSTLALEYNCNLIALTMSSENGIPKDADGRLELAFNIYEYLIEKGVESSKIYFDPLVLPVCVNQDQALESLNTIRMLKESFESPVKTVIGLSNISNGVPAEYRFLINRVFGVLAYGAGLDSAIIDARDNELVRIFKMLDTKIPENELDCLYINIAKMMEDFSDISDVEYNKNDINQVNIIKAAEILSGKQVYTHSFTQI